ncbi:HD domain-containing protein [Flavobacterium okayamense]|uniref:Metal-dependent hydrolase n=1 Tax=Flavobacterium okayamense TaxID=2830782 RepID=A0ABM7SF18_9FLAO|nr:hypothetical protein [Flavobacterium okayamense]BCY29361.1 metal-dependent hydrolase [Flavobacterium okayamense]
MNLENIFTALLLKIGFESNEIGVLWKGLEKAYSAKSRYYHNLTHLQEMIAAYDEYHSHLQHPDEVLFAIFYHDIIYKTTRKDNELKSAEFAVSLIQPQHELDKELVFEMILATQHHQFNIIEDINWLIDFDLKILSKSWEEYQVYCNQIRKEYKIYPDVLYKPGRKKALEHFLEHEFIYQTETFRNLYEKQARENIQREINLL